MVHRGSRTDRAVTPAKGASIARLTPGFGCLTVSTPHPRAHLNLTALAAYDSTE
jgi:hypothetical protein